MRAIARLSAALALPGHFRVGGGCGQRRRLRAVSVACVATRVATKPSPLSLLPRCDSAATRAWAYRCAVAIAQGSGEPQVEPPAGECRFCGSEQWRSPRSLARRTLTPLGLFSRVTAARCWGVSRSPSSSAERRPVAVTVDRDNPRTRRAEAVRASSGVGDRRSGSGARASEPPAFARNAPGLRSTVPHGHSHAPRRQGWTARAGPAHRVPRTPVAGVPQLSLPGAPAGCNSLRPSPGTRGWSRTR